MEQDDYRIQRVKNVLRDLDNSSVYQISKYAAMRIVEVLNDVLMTVFRFYAETTPRKINKETALDIIDSHENSINLDSLIKQLKKASYKPTINKEDVELAFSGYLRETAKKHPEIFESDYKIAVFARPLISEILTEAGIQRRKKEAVEYIMSILYNITKIILESASEHAEDKDRITINEDDVEYALDKHIN